MPLVTSGPIPCTKVIVQKYPEIRRCLYIDVAFPYMVKSGVISSDQRKELLELSPTDRVERFLLWLQEGDDRMLQKFISCLKSSANDTNEHKHLAFILEKALAQLDTNDSGMISWMILIIVHSIFLKPMINSTANT